MRTLRSRKVNSLPNAFGQLEFRKANCFGLEGNRKIEVKGVKWSKVTGDCIKSKMSTAGVQIRKTCL